MAVHASENVHTDRGHVSDALLEFSVFGVFVRRISVCLEASVEMGGGVHGMCGGGVGVPRGRCEHVGVFELNGSDGSSRVGRWRGSGVRVDHRIGAAAAEEGGSGEAVVAGQRGSQRVWGDARVVNEDEDQEAPAPSGGSVLTSTLSLNARLDARHWWRAGRRTDGLGCPTRFPSRVPPTRHIWTLHARGGDARSECLLGGGVRVYAHSGGTRVDERGLRGADGDTHGHLELDKKGGAGPLLAPSSSLSFNFPPNANTNAHPFSHSVVARSNMILKQLVLQAKREYQVGLPLLFSTEAGVFRVGGVGGWGQKRGKLVFLLDISVLDSLFWSSTGCAEDRPEASTSPSRPWVSCAAASRRDARESIDATRVPFKDSALGTRDTVRVRILRGPQPLLIIIDTSGYSNPGPALRMYDRAALEREWFIQVDLFVFVLAPQPSSRV
ncbi:hypothetical protein B0H16DRAFT_1481522 [Mycena metata]|uniref:Uncharacterized protein n=1 Tax=Mycena metata TaxID=1033252 RepID=A0AAD7MAH9_9AGAR|nr:hypothetical protein B0H16DRAFT_1481522 [Mycena metata]